MGERGRVMKHVWTFIHNAVAHPMIAFPYRPRWAVRFHDWTAERMGE